MKDSRIILSIAGFSMAVAVALGAFGAHALQDNLSAERMETWETAVSYHFWNTLGLMAVAIASRLFDTPFAWSAGLITGGILIFPGSLYLLCLSGVSWLGAVTPVGGVLFIAGWITYGITMLRLKK